MQSPRGVLDALLPHVEAGDAVVVGEIDPRAYELVLQHRPRIARLFEVVRVEPASGASAIEIARDWATQNELDVDDETLAEALDLATHYLPAAASPGNVLRVLELVRDRIARGVASAIDPETVIATLSDATGLPLHVLDPRAPLSLDRVRAYFGARVLGQPEAVECLVDRIALVKAGLTDPTRPARRLSLRRPDRHRQDGDRQGVQRLRVRLGGPARPARHERVPDAGEPRPPPRRREHAAPAGCPADRPGPQAAVLRPPARRVREGAPADLGHLPPGLRRRPAHRPQRAHGRPAALRDHPHLQPRLGDPEPDPASASSARPASSTPRPCSSPSTAPSGPSS